MKINNLSNVSFKSIYVVDDGFKNDPNVPMRRDIAKFLNQINRNTEKLYDLLSLGGENTQVRLMHNGGMFRGMAPEALSEDLVNSNCPPLLLVDDKVSQPAKKVGNFVKQVEDELIHVNSLNLATIKSRLSPGEIQQVMQQRESNLASGAVDTEMFDFTLAFVEKVKKEAARGYKKLYAEFAAGDVIKLPANGVEETRKAMLNSGLGFLSKFRK